MSRSWRIHAAGAYWCDRRQSEKADKKAWHRRFRTKSKQAAEALRRVWTSEADWDAAFAGVHVRAVSNPWDMDKDGKSWWHRHPLRDVRRGRRILCGARAKPRPTWIAWIGEPKPETPRRLHRMLGK